MSYSQLIIDAYKYPANNKVIPDADIVNGDLNPSCGDELTLYLKIDDQNNITDIGFQGSGCVISQASMSMLTEILEDMTVDEAKALTTDDIEELLSIELTSMRKKCAFLSLRVLHGAFKDSVENS